MLKLRQVCARLLSLSPWFWSLAAAAQTGVSDDRISLPDGPGSIEGLGDSATIDANMGIMHYEVPIDVPRGFAGVTPELALVYSSGGGSTSIGLGWDLHVPSIERMTLRGLPRYDAEDEIAANGGEQLVRVSSKGGTAVYRTRFEGSFVRYTWHGAGPEGYFTAEYPDGSVGYFGADARGTLVPSARTSHAGQTFRYYLVERVDVFGHWLRHEYTLVEGVPLLSRVTYVQDANGTPTYRVDLAYEARPDQVSDAKPGWDERLTRRLSGISVYSRGERIRRYSLSYEAEHLSGGLSRLTRVESFGRGDTLYPVVFSFAYSSAVSGVCSVAQCARPFVVDMGTLSAGVSIASGDATLVDLNGDALPDLVDASQAGAHRIYINTLGADGQARFESEPRFSALATRSAFPLSAASVQVFDVNGDGFADLTNSLTRRVLCNNGSGDWVNQGCDLGQGVGVTLDTDITTPGDPNPLGVRFLDVDNDRRVDLLSTPGESTVLVRRNTGSGFEELRGQPIGREFDRDRLALADMNGDGLLDPTEVDENGMVRYRLHLGRARWSSTWKVMTGPEVPRSELDDAVLEDLNADGLDDLVLVVGGQVRYAVNRNGLGFDPFRTVRSGDLAGNVSLPVRNEFTTVVFADMNANGSRDIVWIETGGRVRYLELFPVRPNLLSRIENGIGSVQEIHYATAAAQRSLAESPWVHPMTQPMTVVERIDSWVTLTGGEQQKGLHDITEYRYRDGFYDGVEKAFRGFGRVEEFSGQDSEDDSQEASRILRSFDVGANDPYFHGRELQVSWFSGEGLKERELREERTNYSDCPVEGLAGTRLDFAVRFICQTEHIAILKEGAPRTEWATLRDVRSYDGYGNVVLSASLGVAHMGPPESKRECAPCARPANVFGAACGPSCTGDESYVATEYVVPGANTDNRYMLGFTHTVRRYGRDGGVSTEERTYYDGRIFEGLPIGRLTQGNATRITARVHEDSAEVIQLSRRAFDAHGNVTTEIDPNGSVADASVHRRNYQYDPTGLRVVRAEVPLRDATGAYSLVQEVHYEPLFDRTSRSSPWRIEVPGGSQGATESARSTLYTYDEFGRLSTVTKPGDGSGRPTSHFSYELSSPASAVRTWTRSKSGAQPDIEGVTCIDGLGRVYQIRARAKEDSYLVTGFAVLNPRGATVRAYQPYMASSGACDTVAPERVLATNYFYDAARREIERREPDGALYGSASVYRTQYAPLRTRHFDSLDTDPTSPFAGTPTTQHKDGLGRIVAYDRQLGPTATESIVARYDALGRLRGYLDPAGHEKVQRYDLLGRLVEIRDPNQKGVATFAYDGVGNLVERVDARGVKTRSKFDGANRPIARWDGAAEDSTRIEWRYDRLPGCERCTNAEGQLVEMRFPLNGLATSRGIERLGYDQRSRPSFQERTLEGFAYRFEQQYDNADRLTDAVFPDGRALKYVYDSASRLVSVPGVVRSIEYDARGLPTETKLANGIVIRETYDELMRALRSTVAPEIAPQSVFQGFGYARDRVGNVTAVSDESTESGLGPLDATHSYDAYYRDLAVKLGSETLSYAFDALDNVVVRSSSDQTSTEHLGALSYGRERPNAVANVGAIDFAYDDAGNAIRRGKQDLNWDFLGRLTQVKESDRTTNFLYGADQSRRVKIEAESVSHYLTPDFIVRDGIASLYVRVGGHRVARLDSAKLAAQFFTDLAPQGKPDGEIHASDAWLSWAGENGLASLSELYPSDSERLLAASARRMLIEAGPERAYLHHDHLGSITLATDPNGAIVGQRSFYPTGAAREQTGGYVDAFGFTGQELDESTGFIHFDFRYLDPSTGRFLSMDPAFEVTSSNNLGRLGESTTAYAYVAGNWSNAVDPTGLMLTTLVRAASAGGSRRISTVARPNAVHKGQQIPGHIAFQLTGRESAALSGILGREVGPGLGFSPDKRAPKEMDPAKTELGDGTVVQGFKAPAAPVEADKPMKDPPLRLDHGELDESQLVSLARLIKEQPSVYKLLAGPTDSGCANCVTFAAQVHNALFPENRVTSFLHQKPEQLYEAMKEAKAKAGDGN